MLFFLKDKKECTGCTACKNACPMNCIYMKQDDEGFYYPNSDDRCIQCNKCKNICPIVNKNYESIKISNQFAVAAITKNKGVWKLSSSGGAFSEICNAFGDDETVVFGARFRNLRVVHDYIIGVKNISVFRKSKYVQSDLENCFKKAEEFLKSGKKVLFSGLPCQIAGLKSYLKKNYEKLLCVDLICHGVGSPKVFKRTLKYYEKNYGANIKDYSFRNKKRKFGNLQIHVSRHELENKKIFYIERDVYNEFFLNQLCLRPSCGGNCKFRTSNRLGDLTIADFKNKSMVFPKLKDYKNYSTIVINNVKGNIVFNKLKKSMIVLPCKIDDVKRYNPLFYRHTADNPQRNEFFNDFIKGIHMEELIIKYVSKPSFKISNFIRDYTPYRLKALYRNFRSKLENILTKKDNIA